MISLIPTHRESVPEVCMVVYLLPIQLFHSWLSLPGLLNPNSLVAPDCLLEYDCLGKPYLSYGMSHLPRTKWMEFILPLNRTATKLEFRHPLTLTYMDTEGLLHLT